MAYWKPKNKTTKVLKRKTVKKTIPRKVGVRNLTDKTAKKLGRTGRVKGWVNTTDGAKRKSHRRVTPVRRKKVANTDNIVTQFVEGSLMAVPNILRKKK